METEDTRRIVKEFCGRLSSRDLDGLFAHFAPGARWDIVGRPDRFAFGGEHTVENAQQMLSGFLPAFREFRFDVVQLIAENNKAVVEGRALGKGPGAKIYKNNFLMLFTLKDSKIVSISEYFDPFEVLDYVEQPV